MSKGGDRLVRDVIDALAASVDAGELRRRLSGHFPQVTAEPARRSPQPTGGGELSQAAQKLQSRIGLADILDDAILNARSGDRAFPLRLLFGQLVTDCGDDDLTPEVFQYVPGHHDLTPAEDDQDSCFLVVIGRHAEQAAEDFRTAIGA